MHDQVQHQGVLTKQTDKGKIVVLTFMTEKGELSPTAFKDNAPVLEIGKTYVFTTEKKESGGKSYLNLKTKWKGKEAVGYYIEEWVGVKNNSFKDSTSRLPTPAPSKDPREEYWVNREKLDIERDQAMQRGGYSHDAATIVAALLHSGIMMGDPIEKVIEYTKKLVIEAKKKEDD